MVEKKIEKYFCMAVGMLGGTAIKIHSAWFTGLPDRLVILEGIGMQFVELKSTTGGLRPRQKFVIDWLRSFGVQVAVISSKEEVDTWVQGVRIEMNKNSQLQS